MRIRLLGPVSNARGSFRRGQVVDWPEPDARPLVDVGAADLVKDKKVKPAPTALGEER